MADKLPTAQPLMIPEPDDEELDKVESEISMIIHAARHAMLALQRGDPKERVADYLADATKWSKIASDSCTFDDGAASFARGMKRQE